MCVDEFEATKCVIDIEPFCTVFMRMRARLWNSKRHKNERRETRKKSEKENELEASEREDWNQLVMVCACGSCSVE